MRSEGFYWIKLAYGDDPEEWVVARFWTDPTWDEVGPKWWIGDFELLEEDEIGKIGPKIEPPKES